ncbi:LysR family transcriptional regulator [Paenibacillus hodogayensis]|uniref:LysR family transcriptional regulator n=1 Tax=Paenibacillus hodogayensis TaxID=279208 RepID=A0ABV5VV82_9BACL
MLNLHALRLFYTVARKGSTTKAAQALNMSQPAISAQIRKFEKEQGIVLFQIEGRRLRLTPLGQCLLEPLEKLFRLEAQVLERMEEERNFPKGRLRIVGNYLATSLLIPRWAALFKQSRPEVEVHIATANSRTALERLVGFEADAAVYGLADLPLPADDELCWTELYRDEFWFVVAPGHKYAGREVALGDMLAEPFIMREEGSVTRDRLMRLCRERQLDPPRIELQFNDLSGTLHAVMAGYGTTFVSSLVAGGYVERGELARVHVADVRVANTIVLCTRRQSPPDPLVREFTAIAVRHKHSPGHGL